MYGIVHLGSPAVKVVISLPADMSGNTAIPLTPEQIALSQAGIVLSFDGADIGPDLAQARAIRTAEVVALLEQKKNDGFTVPSGAAAGAILQTRDATDTSNWLTLKDGVRDAIEAGMGASVGVTFRTQSNDMVPVTFNDALSVLNALRDYGFALQQRSFELKDAILGAVDVAALAAIDITEGWPS